MTSTTSPASTTVADMIARRLAEIGVRVAFGVISIHNMPILDAIARQGRIRFVGARGEAGAFNMADAYARVSHGPGGGRGGALGVVITSTGTGAGNAAGASVEALTACSPVLHITATVDRKFADRDRAAIHDVPRQPDMLKAVSKAYLRVWDGAGAPGLLDAAVRLALSAPMGPVALEIPVDVQRDPCRPSRGDGPIDIAPVAVAGADLDRLAAMLAAAKRPMLWLGGGARHAGAAATALADRGVGIVTSTNGRAAVAEDHPGSLGAYTMTPEAGRLYAGVDLMIVVGSRLRGNETRNNDMVLPRLLAQVDADPTQAGRNYPVDLFVQGDSALVLAGLAERLAKDWRPDPPLARDIAAARAESEAALRATLSPYQAIADVLAQRVPAGRHPWVRDVTISNSTFGNRYVRLAAPHLGVHALGGGIGQGLPMAIGAALAGETAKTIVLAGDGGLVLSLGELLTAVQERAALVIVLMNDQAYGVIQNIQDAQYQGRRHYSALHAPDFAMLARSVGLPHERVQRTADFAAAFDRALAIDGPAVVEVDMRAIGPFAQSYGGPPAGAAGGAR